MCSSDLKSVLSLVLILFLIAAGNTDSSTSGDTQKNDTLRRNSTTKGLIEASDKPFRCYTCSWSEMANSSVPNVDTCSSYKFVPEAGATVACDYGCQTVAYRTTKTSGTEIDIWNNANFRLLGLFCVSH